MVTENDRRAFRLAESELAQERTLLSKLWRTGWLSSPKGFPSAKPHPKAQEVHNLAPSQGESIPQDSDRRGWGVGIGGGVVFPPQRWGKGRKHIEEEMTTEKRVRWGAGSQCHESL